MAIFGKNENKNNIIIQLNRITFKCNWAIVESSGYSSILFDLFQLSIENQFTKPFKIESNNKNEIF